MPASSSAAVADLNEILAAVQALRRGDFSKRITALPADPVAFEIARTLNAAMDEIEAWTGGVNSLAWRITDGILGEQPLGPRTVACAPGNPPPPPPLTGAWKETADRLHTMSRTITDMNRAMGCCITAAAEGNDYSRRVAVDVRGEMAELKEVVNRLLERHHMERGAAAV